MKWPKVKFAGKAPVADAVQVSRPEPEPGPEPKQTSPHGLTYADVLRESREALRTPHPVRKAAKDPPVRRGKPTQEEITSAVQAVSEDEPLDRAMAFMFDPEDDDHLRMITETPEEKLNDLVALEVISAGFNPKRATRSLIDVFLHSYDLRQISKNRKNREELTIMAGITARAAATQQEAEVR